MSENRESIHAGYSFRKSSSSELDAMSGIASDAQMMVRAAAHPVEAGETVKAQMNRAATNLRYSAGDWRVKAAWYGEAGSWGAAMFRDFEERFNAWKARQEKRSNASEASTATFMAAMCERLSRSGEAVDREQAKALADALRAMGIELRGLGQVDRPSESKD